MHNYSNKDYEAPDLTMVYIRPAAVLALSEDVTDAIFGDADGDPGKIGDIIDGGIF